MLYNLISINFDSSQLGIHYKQTVQNLRLLIYNPSHNNWHKVKKSSKIGQDFKNLLSNFVCFLTAIVKV